MAVFKYTALDTGGRQVRGSVEAGSAREARRKVRGRDLHVVAIKEDAQAAGESRKAEGTGVRLRGIRFRSVALMTRQLATLLRAGMPVVPALSALGDQLRGEPLQRVILHVRDRVNEGASLADALAEHPKVFSGLYVNMVRAGETAGALEGILLKLADVAEKQVNLRNKALSATAYPAFMAVIGVGVILFLLAFVLPTITKLFTELERGLPWPTVALIWLSGFCRRYLWAILLALAGGLLALRWAAGTPRGRALWDRLRLRLPLFGELARKVAVARFARTFGVLLASGIQPVPGLDIVKNVIGNSVLADVVAAAQERVRRGDTLAEPLRQSGEFPPIVCHMIAVGEQTGNLEDGLLHVADAYDSDVEATVGALTSLLEPVMILVMGLVVGFIVLAILLPIFEMNQAIH